MSDYRHIIKIALFTLDEIFGDWNGEITCKEFCEFYAKFSKMYIMSRKELYTEKNLEVFEVSYKWKLSLKIITENHQTTKSLIKIGSNNWLMH